MAREPRPTPTVVLKRLRRSAGECPACRQPLTGTSDRADGENATYACGSTWWWFNRPGTPKAGKCLVKCEGYPNAAPA